MLRRGGLLFALTALVAGGCAIDRIEWERTGFVVDAATRALEEEHHAKDPFVECIKREVGGAVWECRAHTEHDEFTCDVKAGPREKIHELECERREE